MGFMIGIDLGTSSVKALVMDEEGRVRGVRAAGYPILTPREGFAEQEPATWWRLAARTVRATLTEAAVSPSDIRCIGLSGQMHGMVPLDSRGDVVRPSIIWCDQRSAREVEDIYAAVGRDRLGRVTYNPLHTGFHLASLAWVRRHEPDNYRRVASVILPKDYLRYRLTGSVGTDESDASSTLAFDVAARRWSAPLLESLDLSPSLFPCCSRSIDVVGTVSATAADETGLAAGTPVVAGGSDQPMQAVGNGLTAPGTLSLTIGTGGQLYTVSDQPVSNPAMNTHTFCNVIPGKWYLMAATHSAGLSLSWLRDLVAQGSDFAALTAEAGAVPPGSEGLVFLPYLAGERTPHLDPDARAVFFGLTLRHTRAHLVRAVMEGVAYSFRDCRDVMARLGVRTDSIVGSGGGARSPLWLQILADVLDRDIYLTRTVEQACYGAAMTAGIGVGMWRGYPEACAALVRRDSRVISPRRDAVRLYDERFAAYRGIYQATRGFLPHGCAQ